MSPSPNRQRQRAATTRFASNVFFLLAIFLILIPSSRANSSLSRPSQTNAATMSTVTIAFSSAVVLKSSILNQLAQLASTPAIPLPSNISYYDTLRQLADDAALAEKHAGGESHGSDVVHPDQRAESLAGRGTTLRVMIVGDSMTQGQQGDWTWRYRIWEWFQAQGIAVNFVGPYVGTVVPRPPAPPSPPPLYRVPPPNSSPSTSGGDAAGASAAFDGNHFAV